MVDSFFLELCLKKAWDYQLLTLPNPSVSAILVDEFGAILASGVHKGSGEPHAEVLCLQNAYALRDSSILGIKDSLQIHKFLLENAKGCFKNCTMFVSLEPCSSQKRGKTPSCAMLLKELGLKRVVIGAKDCDKFAKGGSDELKNAGISVVKIWEDLSLEHLSNKFKELLLPFYLLQKNGRFILFKYASRLDGSINGGQISSVQAQAQMHNIRAVADFLLISGKTVRLDCPKLDTRFATLSSRNPNVLILTKEGVTKNAPLFNVPNRSVEILHNLESLEQKSGFIFCEGASGLFSTLLDKIDMLLIILNPSFLGDFSLRMKAQANFDILHTKLIGDDLFLFLKPKNTN